ncbi:MAG TPA: OmpA family protein [Gemmatimonadales bacterium]|nr:OmpA family protein [Gemmatimonadales bacterium]
MQRIELLVVTGLAAVALAACGGHPSPVTTAQPQANADSLARERAREDSIARAEEARRAEEAARAAAQRRADSLAALQKTAQEVRTELATMVHFDFDRAIIRPGDATLLDRKVPLLQVNPSLRLRIAGHCDERGSDEYNLALGNRRAIAARQYLMNHGIDGSRIETVSYGKERPLDPGHSETAWAMNRRDEFEVLNLNVVLRKP